MWFAGLALAAALPQTAEAVVIVGGSGGPDVMVDSAVIGVSRPMRSDLSVSPSGSELPILDIAASRGGRIALTPPGQQSQRRIVLTPPGGGSATSGSSMLLVPEPLSQRIVLTPPEGTPIRLIRPGTRKKIALAAPRAEKRAVAKHAAPKKVVPAAVVEKPTSSLPTPVPAPAPMEEKPPVTAPVTAEPPVETASPPTETQTAAVPQQAPAPAVEATPAPVPPAPEPAQIETMKAPAPAVAAPTTMEAPAAPPAPVAMPAPVEPPPAQTAAPEPPPTTVAAVTPPPAAIPAPPVEKSAAMPSSATVALAFDSGDARLNEAHRALLKSIVARLNENADDSVQLLAYAQADNRSKARRLSLSRALAVRSYLLSQDIRNTRIEVRALGDQVPAGKPDRVDVILQQHP